MTREEAIAQLEDLREHCKEYIKEDEEGFGVWSDDVEALNIAINALEHESSVKKEEFMTFEENGYEAVEACTTEVKEVIRKYKIPYRLLERILTGIKEGLYDALIIE